MPGSSCGAATRAAGSGSTPPTLLIAQNHHIVPAIGRDYSDVAPIDGILLAPGEQTLKVEVDVTARDDGAGLTGARWSPIATVGLGDGCDPSGNRHTEFRR